MKPALIPFGDPFINGFLDAVGSRLRRREDCTAAPGNDSSGLFLSFDPCPLTRAFPLAILVRHRADALATHSSAVVLALAALFAVPDVERYTDFADLKFAASHKIPPHFNTDLGGFVPEFWDTRS